MGTFKEKQHPYTNDKRHGKEKDPLASALRNGNGKTTLLYLLAFLALWLLLLLYCFPSNFHLHYPPATTATTTPTCPSDTARFYIHRLPPRFNDHLLLHCHTLNIYTDMCPHVANRGLGRPIDPLLPSSNTWYATHQFIAEMIFHARAELHPCRTRDPSEADLFYVPFYGGLYASSVFRETSLPDRDRLGEDLADHLVRLPSWGRRQGADHFLAIGRTSWDFMRSDDGSVPDFGANRLFLLPAVRNMTVLTVEKPTFPARNMFGIPYPSYFHPATSDEVAAWQERVRNAQRTHLFAFVGGPRKPSVEKAAVRAEILRQCGASPRCRRSECDPGSSLCHEPSRVMEVMTSAEFCMQPPGDSFTRRSVFDSVLAGCVPVFFSEHTAYSQYGWYLPAAREEYSVMIPEAKWGSMEAELAAIPKPEVEQLRQRVIELIPSLMYAHPNATGPGFRDAVDIALAQLTARLRETEKPE